MSDEPYQSPQELGERLRRLQNAGAEQTLSGALRRAIRVRTKNVPALASRIECDLDLFSDWQEGLADLPSGIMDRLAQELGVAIAETVP